MDVHVNVPKLQAEFAAALGQDLAALRGSEDAEVKAALEAAPGPVVEALDGVVGAGAELSEVMASAREGVPLRGLDLTIDRVIGAVVRTLRQRRLVWSFEAFAELRAEERAQLERVDAALAELDSDGLGFLRLPFSRQYYRNTLFVLAMRRHLPLLEELGLGGVAERLELLNAHYGAAQGFVETPEAPLKVSVVDATSVKLGEFQEALDRYCLEIAYHYRGAEQAAARAVFLGALERQTRAQRAAQARRERPEPDASSDAAEGGAL